MNRIASGSEKMPCVTSQSSGRSERKIMRGVAILVSGLTSPAYVRFGDLPTMGRSSSNSLPSVTTFRTGESVVWRSVWRDIGVVGTAWPGTVVHDEPDLIALYRPVGANGKPPTGGAG